MKKLKFSDVFEDITRQGTKIQTSQYLACGKYQIIDQSQNDIAGFTNREDGLFTGTPVIVFGDHTRVIKYVDRPCFFGADGVKLLKVKNDYLNCRYLYYVLLNAKIPDTGYNRHYKWLKEIDIPIYDAKIQNIIVKMLDKIADLIDKRKKQLEKLDELVKSRFIEMFGDPEENTFFWKEQPLSEHLSVIGGYAFKSDQFSKGGIPVLKIGNINSGTFKPVNLVYWEDDDTLSRYKMYPGDLVMSLTGTVGKDDYGNVCILGNDYDVYYLNQRNAKLELCDTLNKYYLSMLLKFEPIKKKLTGISRGVRQANISNKDILNLTVPIPPIELQNQFAAFVEQVDKSKSEIKQGLEKLELLKKALMQKYFR